MATPERTKAQQIAQAAAEFEKTRTGRTPQSVTVVLSGETLVVTLHGALSPAELSGCPRPCEHRRTVCVR
jgi:uncharacterized protein YbcI